MMDTGGDGGKKSRVRRPEQKRAFSNPGKLIADFFFGIFATAKGCLELP